MIRRLLTEAGQANLPPPADPAAADLKGVAVQADMGNLRSPETYLGHARAEQFASPGGQRSDAAFDYSLPTTLALNQWGLSGRWTVTDEAAQLQQAGGRIAFQFHARDLHLVLAPSRDGRPVRFRVWLDGRRCPPPMPVVMSAPMAVAWSTSIACTSWYASAARSVRIASRSNSSMRACRPMPSPSVEPGAHDETLL